jgi:hypothetical protein
MPGLSRPFHKGLLSELSLCVFDVCIPYAPPEIFFPCLFQSNKRNDYLPGEI